MYSDREEQHLASDRLVSPILHTGYSSHPRHWVELLALTHTVM